MRLLAYVAGSVNQELLLQNEYLGRESTSPYEVACAVGIVRS
jgi:hypothetical protein